MTWIVMMLGLLAAGLLAAGLLAIVTWVLFVVATGGHRKDHE